jgi:hypothetical protein
MPHYREVLTLHSLGSVSLLLGVLGAIFFWTVPTGIVLCIIGFLAGFIGLTMGPQSKAVRSLLIAGVVVSLLALTLDSVAAGMGWETISFHALR